jgi:hypothetical protein
MVAPYYKDSDQTESPAFEHQQIHEDDPGNIIVRLDAPAQESTTAPIAQTQPRRRGRPRGSKNKSNQVFLLSKEVADRELAIKLRKNGIINTPGLSFEKSDNDEINDLIACNVFRFELYNPAKYDGMRVKGHAGRGTRWFRVTNSLY